MTRQKKGRSVAVGGRSESDAEGATAPALSPRKRPELPPFGPPCLTFGGDIDDLAAAADERKICA